MKRAAYALSVLLCGAALWAQVSPGQHGPLGPFKPGVIIDTTPTDNNEFLTDLIASWSTPTFTAATNVITAWADDGGGSCGAACDLSPTNSPTVTGGATSLALSVNGTTQFLSVADNTTVSIGSNVDFGFCAWIVPTLDASFRAAVRKNSGTQEYTLGNIRTATAPTFVVGDSSSGSTTATWGANLTDATRVFLCGWYTSSDKKAHISVNNGTAADAPAGLTNGPLDGAAPLGIPGPTAGTALVGTEGPVFFYKGGIPPISTLYNSGKGIEAEDAPTTNLVCAWPLSETGAAARTSVSGSGGSGCDLAATNAPTVVVGNVQTDDTRGNTNLGAKLASASSMYLSVADNASLSMGDIDFSVSCWYNPAAVGSAVTLMAKGTEYQLGVNASNQATFLVDTTTATDLDPTQSANTWYMVTGVRDKGTALNVTLNNGTFVTATDDTAADGAAAFALGSLSTPGTYANGTLASCAVWKRVLTQAEVTTLYASGAGRFYDYAWWLMLRDPVRWAFRVLFDPYQTLSRDPNFQPYAGA